MTLYIADDGTIIGEQLNLYTDLHRRTLAPDEREITDEEFEWAKQQSRERGLWNGCTDFYLRERFGDRLRHIMGFGWVVRDAPEEESER